MLTTKITFALADWIREWRKCRDKNPFIDECVKCVKYKLEYYKGRKERGFYDEPTGRYFNYPNW